MRDPKRIRKFCNQLANFWESECPDWRFGQLICNLFSSELIKIDPFFIEEKEMMEIIKKYFGHEE